MALINLTVKYYIRFVYGVVVCMCARMHVCVLYVCIKKNLIVIQC